MPRKNRNITLDEDLYKAIRVIAAMNEKNINDIIEEGMKLVIEKYKKDES